jgi:antitoxin YefM
MTIEASYSDVRAKLAEYMDRTVDDRDVIVVRRRNGKNIAIIAEDELRSLMETVYLMSSPKNAQRLLTALHRAERGETQPHTLEELQSELGFAER